MKAGLKLFFWFAVVLCFSGIPLFIGMWGVDRLIFYKHENRKNQVFAAGRKTLESWKSISSDKDVFFRICSGIFSSINSSQNPSNDLQSCFSRIPEKFRRKMKVEVWDIEGNPLWGGDGLREGRSVSKKTRESLQKVLTLSPAFSLQGEVFWQEDAISELVGPILGQTAERFIKKSIPVLVVSGRTLKLDWYQVYVSEKFILRCVIPKETVDQGNLFQRLVDRFNLKKAGKAFLRIFSSEQARENSAIRANLVHDATHGRHADFPSKSIPTIPETELSLAIGGVKTGLETQFETPSSLVVFSPAGNKLRLALIFPKEKAAENLDYLRNAVFQVLTFSLGMLAIFCFFIIVPDRPLYFSIKWKLGLIFLFSNAIPLVVLGLLANDFLFQKRLTMLNEAYSHAEKILRSVDNRFYMEVALPESFLERHCKILGKRIPHKKFECYDTLEKLRGTLKRFPIIYYTLIKNDGKFFLSPYIIRPHGTALDEIFKDPMVTQNDKLNEAQFFSALGEKAFEEMNFESLQGREKRSETDAKLAVLESLAERNLGRSLEEILNEGFVGLGKIQNIGLLGELWAFWNFILNPQSGKKEFLLYAVFSPRKMRKKFIETCVADTFPKPYGMKIFAYYEKNFFSPPEVKISPGIRNLGYKSEIGNSIVSGNLIENGQRFLGVAFPAKEIKGATLIGVIPLGNIDRSLGYMKKRFFLFGVLSLVFSVGIGQILARRFLHPIGKLSGVAAAIEEKRFDHRLPSLGADEFGSLARIYNEVLEDLEEMSVARIVQESLFPANAAEFGSFRVFGKSLPMGELGGDYFDFFPVGDSKFGLLIGDVAGHGVPAALLMAMAKGAVFNNRDSWDSPEELLKHINDVIISSKKSRHQTRLFSCLYLVGDRDTGKIRIVNAGHNYPIQVKPALKSSEYLEIPGSPLGTLKKPRIGKLDLEILPGEFLVLYTDGAVEVRNNSGMEFGYSRWQELMLKVGSPRPELIFESLLKEHLRHRGETSPQDDVTIIVLSRT